METLKIIAYIMTVLSYGILAYTAIALYFKMRRMQKDMYMTKEALREIFGMTMSLHVDSKFDQVEKMKETLQELIENEQYEDAERLRNAIEQAQEAAVKQMEILNKYFDSEIIEINMVKRTTN